MIVWIGVKIDRLQIFTIKHLTLFWNPSPPNLADYKTMQSFPFDLWRGQSLLFVSLNQLSEKLLETGEVCGVNIQKVWPNELKMDLELCPILLWEKKGNFVRPYLKSHTLGAWRPALQSHHPSIRPWVVFKDERNDHEKKEVMRRLSQMFLAADPKGLGEIEEIWVDKDQGVTLLSLKTPLKVLLGEDDWEIKARRVTRVLDYLAQKNIEARVIDAFSAQKVLVRARNQP